MKTKQSWLEKYQLFVYLIIIIVGLSLVKAKYGYKEEKIQNLNVKSQNEEKPTETVTPTPTINQYPLQSKLPYYGKGFVVEKYTAPMTLKMVLNGASESTAVKAVTVWLNSFGEAIGQHKIEIEE